MNKSLENLSVLLKNIDVGFVLVESNDRKERAKLLEMLAAEFNYKLVDLKQKIVYPTEFKDIDNIKYNGIAVHSIEGVPDPKDYLEALNICRDSMRMDTKLPIVFIMTVELSDYMAQNLPNLNSYVTFKVNIDREFKPPFRYMLSWDEHKLSPKLQLDEQRVNTELYKVLNIKEFETLLDFYINSNVTFVDLKHLKGLYANNFRGKLLKFMTELKNSKLENKQYLSQFLKLQLKYADILRINGAYKDAITEYNTYLFCKLCLLGMEPESPTLEHVRESLSFNNEQIEDNENNSVFHAASCIGYCLFYKKKYQAASKWFSLSTKLRVTDKELLILAINDMCVVSSKMKFSATLQASLWTSLMETIKDIDSKGCLIMEFNSMIHQINSNAYLTNIADEIIKKLDEIENSIGEDNLLYTSYLDIAAWYLGVGLGMLEHGFIFITEAIEIKSGFLHANDLHLAESYYVKAILYLMDGRMESAEDSLLYALKIVEKSSSSLTEKCEEIFKQFFTSYPEA